MSSAHHPSNKPSGRWSGRKEAFCAWQFPLAGNCEAQSALPFHTAWRALEACEEGSGLYVPLLSWSLSVTLDRLRKWKCVWGSWNPTIFLCWRNSLEPCQSALYHSHSLLACICHSRRAPRGKNVLINLLPKGATSYLRVLLPKASSTTGTPQKPPPPRSLGYLSTFYLGRPKALHQSYAALPVKPEVMLPV